MHDYDAHLHSLNLISSAAAALQSKGGLARTDSTVSLAREMVPISGIVGAIITTRFFA